MACDPKLTITANDEERIVRMDLQTSHAQFQSWFSALRPEIEDQVYRMNDTAAHAEKSIVCVDPQSKHDKPRITFLELPQEIRDQIYREVLTECLLKRWTRGGGRLAGRQWWWSVVGTMPTSRIRGW